MTKKPTPTAAVQPITDHTKVRTAGLQLLAPLQPRVVALAIRNASDYLDADAMLGSIRNARAKWCNLMEPVQSPISRMDQELKLLKQAVKRLDSEVDGPLEQLEMRVKAAMREWKIKEQRELQAAEDARRLEEARLQAQIDRQKEKEQAARTAPMKARLAAVRENLEVKRDEALQGDMNPAVKGASSSVRTIRKVRVADLAKLVAAMSDYQPKAGIYEFNTPPLSLITPELIQPALNKLYKDQPNVVESWPGIVIEDDILIAGR